jgi:hypothetical protein
MSKNKAEIRVFTICWQKGGATQFQAYGQFGPVRIQGNLSPSRAVALRSLLKQCLAISECAIKVIESLNNKVEPLSRNNH